MYRRHDLFYGLADDGQVLVVWCDPEQPKHRKIATTRVTLETPHADFVEAVRAAEQRLIGPYTEDISRRCD
jgi:hypothetical protein